MGKSKLRHTRKIMTDLWFEFLTPCLPHGDEEQHPGRRGQLSTSQPTLRYRSVCDG